MAADGGGGEVCARGVAGEKFSLRRGPRAPRCGHRLALRARGVLRGGALGCRPPRCLLASRVEEGADRRRKGRLRETRGGVNNVFRFFVRTLARGCLRRELNAVGQQHVLSPPEQLHEI